MARSKPHFFVLASYLFISTHISSIGTQASSIFGVDMTARFRLAVYTNFRCDAWESHTSLIYSQRNLLEENQQCPLLYCIDRATKFSESHPRQTLRGKID